MAEEQLQEASDELEPFEEAPEEPEDAQPPKLVRIRLSGQTLEVTEEQAAVIEAHEAQRQQTIGRMGTELGTLRQQTRQRPEPDSSQDEDIEWLASPAKRAAQLREELRQELRDELRQQKLYDDWWGRFYNANPDLRGKEAVVDAIRYRDIQELSPLDERTCQRELAVRVRDMLGTPAPSGRTLPTRQVQSERSSNASSTRSQSSEDETPQRRYGAFGTALKHMQEKRRAALYRPPKE